jgi:hypothetical protein
MKLGLKTGQRAESQDKPGMTRANTECLMREKPRAFFLDIPGITPPRLFFEERPEAWYGYSAANLLPGATSTLEWKLAFCEYILDCLHRDGMYQSVQKLGLDKPVRDLEQEIISVLKRGKDNDQYDEGLQIKRCDIFLKFFNTGNLRTVILDDIRSPYEPSKSRIIINMIRKMRKSMTPFNSIQ